MGTVTARGLGVAVIAASAACCAGEFTEMTVVDDTSSSVPATVTDLSVAAVDENSVTLEWTQIEDGTGNPADYALRYGSPALSWGSADTTEATVEGTAIGESIAHTFIGLTAGTEYEFGLVSYRGTLNVDATFGEFADPVSTTTLDGEISERVTVTATPSDYQFTAIGETVQISATAYDSNGNAVPDVDFSYASIDPSIVSVDTSGTMTANALGTTAIVVATVCCTADDTIRATVDTTQGLADVAVPAAGDWTDHGVVLSPSAGEWDARLSGMLSPCTVVKIGSTLYLYYIGADGDRSDGGPAHRKLGLATAPDTDPSDLTKYAGNPILTHNPNPEDPNENEEGVFSAGSIREDDGTVRLYFGGMEVSGGGAVDGDIVHTASTDGVNFGNFTDLIRGQDGTGGGDEVFPSGAIRIGDTYYVYWANKADGTLSAWTGMVSGGPSPTNIGTYAEATFLNPPGDGNGRGGMDPIRKSDTEILIPIRKNSVSPETIGWFTAQTSDPTRLTEQDSYAFTNVHYFTIYLDRDQDRWVMYYLNTDSPASIGLRTAPVTYIENGPTP